VFAGLNPEIVAGEVALLVLVSVPPLCDVAYSSTVEKSASSGTVNVTVTLVAVNAETLNSVTGDGAVTSPLLE
jgi:hypothetical protein